MRKYITYSVLLVISTLIAIVYVSLGWMNQISSLGGDSAGYLLAAHYYSPYQPPNDVISTYGKQIFYPPLFPIILALLGGGDHIIAAHETVIAFLLIAMGLLYLWARAEKLSVPVSSGIVMIFALMPATYLTSFPVWTENPYLMFSLLAVVALARETPSERMWLLAAVAVSAALLIRIAALPLGFAFIAYLLWRRPPRIFLLAGIALLPFTLWMIANTTMDTGAGVYFSHLQGKYHDNPLGFFVAQLWVESKALLDAWRYAWLGDAPTSVSKLIVYAFGIFALVGWLARLRMLKFDSIYVAAYLIVLLVWPHPEEALRYSYVLFPLLLLYGFLALLRFPAMIANPRAHVVASIGTFALLAISMAPTLMLNIRYYTQELSEEYSDNKHTAEWYSSDRRQAEAQAIFRTRLLHHLATLSSQVAVKDCVFAIKPTIVTLYTQRTSHASPISFKSDDEFWKETAKCRYVYVLPFASPSYHQAFYPLSRLGPRAKLVSEQRMTEDKHSPLVGALYEISR